MAKGRNGIARQIAKDAQKARFWAALASAPVWTFALLLGASASYVALGPSDDDRTSLYLLGAVVVLFAFLFSMVARWTYSATRAALTPQRIQAMWLRRFGSEGGDAFQTSHLIDRLARDGVSALTLQDREVQLSFEQRRNRLAPTFWILFAPIAALLGFGAANSWRDVQTQAEQWRPTADNLGDAIGQALGQAFGNVLALLLIVLLTAAAFMLATLLFMAVAALAGPIGAAFARNRDDFARLPQHLKAIDKGKRKGATVLRIGDDHWREAVSLALRSTDVIIVDLTDVSENVAWELEKAAKTPGGERIVFICADAGARALPLNAVAQVRAALGGPPPAVAYYPQSRKAAREGERFAEDLRAAIYSAFDRRALDRAKEPIADAQRAR
ncbi:MAG: hypothetical protein ABL883_01920 [Terricaulis sp.]